MKIAFLAPIQASTEYKQRYTFIIDYLLKSGHSVIHALSVSETTLAAWDQEKRDEYFQTFYTKIGKCDMVIAECSLPSVHVGYEISSAMQQGKEVIVLKLQNDKPTLQPLDPLYMHKNIFMYDYTLDNLLSTIKMALEYNPCQKFKKYNILFPTDMVTRLNDIAKRKNLPKSVYIRQLLEQGLKTEEI